MNNILSNIENITLHYCSDCNMMCKYCYIEKHHKVATEKNRQIRQALSDGSFVQHIIDYFPNKEQITGYQLWGAEPTVNGDLFAQTHNALCKAFPNLKSLCFSTNGLVGGEKIVHDFIDPIIQEGRKFTFELQFSLDGPPWLNDNTRAPGATQRTLDALQYVCNHVPKNGNLILQPLVKATFDMEIIRYLVDNNLIQSWYDWYDEKIDSWQIYTQDNPNIDWSNLGPSPSFASPFIATVEDGQYVKKFIDSIISLNTKHFKFFNNFPLFVLGFELMQEATSNNYTKFDVQYGIGSCSAGKNNFSFDWDGSIQTCHHLMPITMDINSSLTFMLKEHSYANINGKNDIRHFFGEYSFHTNFLTRYHIFSALALSLARNNQILSKYIDNEDEMQMLWLVCSIMMCFLSDQEITSNQSILPLGRIRFWGNGGLDSLIKYYNFECKRLANNQRRTECLKKE